MGVEKGNYFIGGLSDFAFRSSDSGIMKVKKLGRCKVIRGRKHLFAT